MGAASFVLANAKDDLPLLFKPLWLERRGFLDEDLDVAQETNFQDWSESSTCEVLIFWYTLEPFDKRGWHAKNLNLTAVDISLP